MALFVHGLSYTAVAGQRISRSEYGEMLVQIKSDGLIEIAGMYVRVAGLSFVDLRKVSSFKLIEPNELTIVDPDVLKCIIPFFFR